MNMHPKPTIRATATITIEVVKKLLEWKVDPDCIRGVIAILQDDYPLLLSKDGLTVLEGSECPS